MDCGWVARWVEGRCRECLRLDQNESRMHVHLEIVIKAVLCILKIKGTVYIYKHF